MRAPVRIVTFVLGLATAVYGTASLTGGWLGTPPWWEEWTAWQLPTWDQRDDPEDVRFTSKGLEYQKPGEDREWILGASWRLGSGSSRSAGGQSGAERTPRRSSADRGDGPRDKARRGRSCPPPSNRGALVIPRHASPGRAITTGDHRGTTVEKSDLDDDGWVATSEAGAGPVPPLGVDRGMEDPTGTIIGPAVRAIVGKLPAIWRAFVVRVIWEPKNRQTARRIAALETRMAAILDRGEAGEARGVLAREAERLLHRTNRRPDRVLPPPPEGRAKGAFNLELRQMGILAVPPPDPVNVFQVLESLASRRWAPLHSYRTRNELIPRTAVVEEGTGDERFEVAPLTFDLAMFLRVAGRVVDRPLPPEAQAQEMSR